MMIKSVMVRLDSTRADARLVTTNPTAEYFDSHVVGLEAFGDTMGEAAARELRTANLSVAIGPNGSSQEPEHLVEWSRLGKNSTRMPSVFARC
jgi:hypothetical protein